MKTSSGSYIIKPTTNWSRDKDTSASKSSFEHAIYRVSATRTRSNNVDLPDEVGHNCGLIGELLNSNFFFLNLKF